MSPLEPHSLQRATIGRVSAIPQAPYFFALASLVKECYALNPMATKTTTALDQLAELQAEFEKKSAAIKEAAQGELVLQMKAKRHELAELERQYEQLTGKPSKHTFGGDNGGEKRKRFTITIEQVKKAIQGGAKNNADIAAHLGVSKANVVAKVKKEGKEAGIKHKGQRVNFEYYLA